MLERNRARCLLIVYTLFILAITLLILGGEHATLRLVPFRSMVHDWRVGGLSLVVNFWGNIIAFLPFGFLLPLVRVRPTRAWHALVLVGLFSVAIEALQYAFAKRTADVDDVILNALGGLLGYGLLRLWQIRVASQFPPEIAQSSSKMA